MERRKWFCETHHMWFNESCELCERSSPESGDRRQDAANDNGSERSSRDIARRIFTLWCDCNYPEAEQLIDQLRSEVSARSADAYEVLGMAISKLSGIIRDLDEQIENDSDNLYFDSDVLEDLRGAYAFSLPQMRMAQNLLKKPG